jgi:adenylate cyclase
MDFFAGQSHMEAALRLDPNSYDAHLFAGYMSLGQQRPEDAIRHFETACALDAEAYRPAGMVVQAYEAVGDEEGALSASRRCLARCERLLHVEPDNSGAMGFLVSSLADLGEAERALEWTKRAVLFDPDNVRLHYNLACAMSKLGEADKAVDLLEGIVGKINPGWAKWIEIDNSLDPIRDHPRYQAFRGALSATTPAGE